MLLAQSVEGRLPQLNQRFVPRSGPHQEHPVVVANLRIGRVDFNCFLEVKLRLSIVSLARQNAGQVVMGCGKVGLQIDRGPEQGLASSQIALPNRSQTEVNGRVRQIRIDGQSMLQNRFALSMFPCCKYTSPRFVRTTVSEGSTAAALSPAEAARVRSLAAASVAAIARRAWGYSARCRRLRRCSRLLQGRMESIKKCWVTGGKPCREDVITLLMGQSHQKMVPSLL
jgi:hypothetical protein